MNPRVRALHDLDVSSAREYAGLHDYDGTVQDLSPAGVASALARIGEGPTEPDRHDEEHLAAFEAGARTRFARLEIHRWNPLVHLSNLDLACYDRDYAPEPEREEARRRHLRAWPEAVDAAVEALDRVPGPVAEALLGAFRGLSVGLGPSGNGPADADADTDTADRALGRLVSHLETAVQQGSPEVALGAADLSALMGDGEAMALDLSRLEVDADREASRVTELLDDACRRMSDRPVTEVVAELLSDHPTADQVGPRALALIDEITEFTLGADLMPDISGLCHVGPAPESRRWAMAMMSWAGPYEPDAASWYYVTPPDPSWSPEETGDWLSVFCPTTLPAITAHEVTPGHFAHARVLRRARGDVRQGLQSDAFVEGWAHYAEELLYEEGFRADDPRYLIGLCVESLIRVTRLRVALALHMGSMTIDEATREFERYAFLKGPAARSEAVRATYDPTYGRYTWGKLEIRRLRDEAMARWGRRYSHLRFHSALLGLGAPPLGLIGHILE